jgi:primary-amine oxidase
MSTLQRATAVRTTTHPLDPLGADEIAVASAAFRAHAAYHREVAFVWVSLSEPGRDELATSRRDGGAPPRRARIVAYDRVARTIIEAVADVSTSEIVSWRAIGLAWPPTGLHEYELAVAAVKQDTRWRAALARRGVGDTADVLVQAWPPGYPHPEFAGRRIANAIAWIGAGGDDNQFARPIEDLVAFVDLDSREVLEVREPSIVAIPVQPGNYAPELATAPGNWPTFSGPRSGLRSIEIAQPEGVSFELEGRRIRWQGFELVVGFTPREGIVLHEIGFRAGGRLRSIVRRASLSEMWVPYGDPALAHRIKNVFDEGECGLGRLANPLQLGCDCLGEIRYLDGVVNDEAGAPLVIPNAICIHEEDTGVAWKHTHDNGSVEVRRGRRLAISSFSTIGNYDYGFFWYLHVDGTIAFEVKLTGVISTGAIAPGDVPVHGTLVAPGVYGPNHQHWFNVRLDTAIDGDANSVYELDARIDPVGPTNAHGNAWTAERTLLERESTAQRATDPAAGRTWLIANDESRNAHGQPVAFQLVPGPAPRPALQPDAPALQRALFATRSLWVTAYDEDELHAAGEYPYGSSGGDGLPAYASGDEPLAQRDIVVWHSFAAQHVVRPEDWPVMPVTTTGFHLRPFGFFDANPTLDLPRPQPSGACTTAHHCR